jgi:predicted DNA-binding protein
MKIIKETQPVRISKEVYDKVKALKEKSGVSIIRFIEDAIEEKINKKKT